MRATLKASCEKQKPSCEEIDHIFRRNCFILWEIIEVIYLKHTHRAMNIIDAHTPSMLLCPLLQLGCHKSSAGMKTLQGVSFQGLCQLNNAFVQVMWKPVSCSVWHNICGSNTDIAFSRRQRPACEDATYIMWGSATTNMWGRVVECNMYV